MNFMPCFRRVHVTAETNDLFKNRLMNIAYIECFGRNNAIIENRKDIYARDNLAVTLFVSIILC